MGLLDGSFRPASQDDIQSHLSKKRINSLNAEIAEQRDFGISCIVLFDLDTNNFKIIPANLSPDELLGKVSTLVIAADK